MVKNNNEINIIDSVTYERIRDIYEILNKLMMYKKDPRDVEITAEYDKIITMLRSALLIENEIIKDKTKD